MHFKSSSSQSRCLLKVVSEQKSHLRISKKISKKNGQTAIPTVGQTAGQTTVEYILLISLLVGAAVVMKNAMLPHLAALIGATSTTASNEAQHGGVSNPKKHYVGSCSVADKTGGC